jgi:hypothetical protein
MAYQNISESLSEERMATIKAAINTITNELPFLITLSSEERKSLYKLGSKSIDFVRDCNNVANNYGEILPSGFDKAGFTDDTLLFAQLSELRMLLDSLSEKVNDTTVAVGNESLKASLIVYDYVKTASKSQAGLKSVAEQLKQRFKGQGNAKKTN